MKAIKSKVILVCIAFLPLQAGAAWEQAWGQWFASEAPGTLFAATVNDSNNIFGQWCMPAQGSCFYYLGIETVCNEGKQIPALVSTSAGALATTLLCSGKLPNQKTSKLTFLNFDEINNAVDQGSRISIVFALEGDQFKVMRFDLNGASAAIAAMRVRAEAQVGSGARPAKGTKDQTL
jgi:hypothetical protein